MTGIETNNPHPPSFFELKDTVEGGGGGGEMKCASNALALLGYHQIAKICSGLRGVVEMMA